MSIIYREMKDQYNALAKVQACQDASSEAIRGFFAGKQKVLFVGSGSSFYVARSAALLFSMHVGISASALPAGDLLLHTARYKALCDGAAVVMLSRSGETSEAIRAASAMREAGFAISLMTVTCAKTCTLSDMSDLVMALPFAYDQSVCQTRTVTCLYYACAAMAADIASETRLIDDLKRAVSEGPAYMERIEADMKTIADGNWTHAVVLGDAEIAGLCEEGALAFKEICQLPSNHHHLLDVRHGPMVLIHDKTLVIAVLSDEKSKLELDLLSDIVKKGAQVVAYADMPFAMEGVHTVSFGQPLSHAARGIPAIAICQLIAYYKSFRTGANPDQPDGLTAFISLA